METPITISSVSISGFVIPESKLMFDSEISYPVSVLLVSKFICIDSG